MIRDSLAAWMTACMYAGLTVAAETWPKTSNYTCGSIRILHLVVKSFRAHIQCLRQCTVHWCGFCT